MNITQCNTNFNSLYIQGMTFNILLVFFLFNSRKHEASFTSNFARLLEAKSDKLPLQEMVKRAARGSFEQHRLSSNLFDPK